MWFLPLPPEQGRALCARSLRVGSDGHRALYARALWGKGYPDGTARLIVREVQGDVYRMYEGTGWDTALRVDLPGIEVEEVKRHLAASAMVASPLQPGAPEVRAGGFEMTSLLEHAAALHRITRVCCGVYWNERLHWGAIVLGAEPLGDAQAALAMYLRQAGGSLGRLIRRSRTMRDRGDGRLGRSIARAQFIQGIAQEFLLLWRDGVYVDDPARWPS
ncbi:MAG: hypothetical protein M0Z66_06500 [Thermaerobacter sp.]|nr:hypothetical protein [Thermaerobacter sp.]